MKKMLLACSITLLTLFAWAQHGVQSKPITDASIVRDTLGNQYGPHIWRALLQTGDYIVSAQHKLENTDFVIRRLSAEEKEQRIMQAAKVPPRESKFFRTGSKISSFTERDMEGNLFKLKDMKDKVVVLNFWFVNCPPCRQEIPELNKLTEKYAGNPDVVFIAIALDPRDQVEEFLKLRPFKYHIIENGRYITNQYGITSYPTHVVIDRGGIIRFHTSGYGITTVYYIEKAIAELLEGGTKTAGTN